MQSTRNSQFSFEQVTIQQTSELYQPLSCTQPFYGKGHDELLLQRAMQMWK